jgi:hypothetical protein
VLQLERRRPTTFGPVSKAATPQGHRGELQGFLGPNTCVHTYTLWLFIDDFPIKTFIYKGFSMAIFSMLYLKLVEQNGDV